MGPLVAKLRRELAEITRFPLGQTGTGTNKPLTFTRLSEVVRDYQ